MNQHPKERYSMEKPRVRAWKDGKSSKETEEEEEEETRGGKEGTDEKEEVTGSEEGWKEEEEPEGGGKEERGPKEEEEEEKAERGGKPGGGGGRGKEDCEADKKDERTEGTTGGREKVGTGVERKGRSRGRNPERGRKKRKRR